MIRSFFSLIWRALRAIWSAVDAGRRFTLNLLFLLIVLALAIGLFYGRSGDLPSTALQDKTTLVVNLSGSLPEQRLDKEGDALVRALQSDAAYQPLLREVIAGIDQAAQDPHITQMMLNLDDLGEVGLASLHEVAGALDRFKARGKPVVAWATGYRQGPYSLAAHASKAYVHPQGSIDLIGFGGKRWYFKDALDKLGVKFHLIKVGTYKSAAEPFIANGPSPAAQEASDFLYGDLWTRFQREVEGARKLAPHTITHFVDTLPQAMQQADGDAAQVALNTHLVDGLKTLDELTPELIKTGAPDGRHETYRHIDFQTYLQRLPPPPGPTAPIGVIVAEGEIVEGRSSAGRIGDRTLTELIRQARLDVHTKAVVLRVNSPGGSALASELIRHELQLLRASGKPVVVSMGNVAASGGYWISLASDAVLADASTVTGSIGVFGLLPTAPEALNKLGIHTGGHGTTWLSDASDPSQPLDPRLEAVVQSSVNRVYAHFIQLAAQARKTTPAKIDAVAQGRVWTGAQAQERGLLDQLGGMQDALKAAAKLAKLPGQPQFRYIEPESKLLSSIVAAMGQQTRVFLGERLQVALGPLAGPAVEAARNDWSWVNDVQQRGQLFSTVTHCLCSLR